MADEVNGYEYIARTGQRLVTDKEAKVFGPIIEAMNGPTPQEVVDIARPESHPFHRKLPWDDAHCGEMYRRHIARKLIGGCAIRIVTIDKQTIEGPAFLATPQRIMVRDVSDEAGEKGSEPERHFSVRVAQDSLMISAYHVREAHENLKSWYLRCKALRDYFPVEAAEFGPVFAFIEDRDRHDICGEDTP